MYWPIEIGYNCFIVTRICVVYTNHVNIPKQQSRQLSDYDQQDKWLDQVYYSDKLLLMRSHWNKTDVLEQTKASGLPVKKEKHLNNFYNTCRHKQCTSIL
jgi:hypothetical protein